MRGFLALAFLLAWSTLWSPAIPAQHATLSDYQIGELRDYVDGLPALPQNLARARRIYHELQQYSGMDFIVIPAQTFQWGQAHAGE
jgi:hypothetical protein